MCVSDDVCIVTEISIAVNYSCDVTNRKHNTVPEVFKPERHEQDQQSSYTMHMTSCTKLVPDMLSILHNCKVGTIQDVLLK